MNINQSTKRRRAGCGGLCLLCGLLLAASASFGATMVGDLLVNSLSSDGTVAHSVNIPFQVSVERSQWRIRVEFGADYSVSVGSDGQKCCGIWNFSESRLIQDGITNPATAKSPAYINGTSFPYTSEPAAEVLWLAFASSGFLSAPDRPSLPALWNGCLLNPVSHAQAISALEYISDSSGLPSRIQFIVSSAMLLRDPTNLPFLSASISPSAIKEAAASIKKFDNSPIATYQVLSTTNFEGSAFPLKFELAVFTPIVGLHGVEWVNLGSGGQFQAL